MLSKFYRIALLLQIAIIPSCSQFARMSGDQALPAQGGIVDNGDKPHDPQKGQTSSKIPSFQSDLPPSTIRILGNRHTISHVPTSLILAENLDTRATFNDATSGQLALEFEIIQKSCQSPQDPSVRSQGVLYECGTPNSLYSHEIRANNGDLIGIRSFVDKNVLYAIVGTLE